MTVHRKVKVRYEHIRVARITLIFEYFTTKLCQMLFAISKLNLSCIKWWKFLQKIFFNGKVKAYIWRISFSPDEKKKRNSKLLININILSPNDFIIYFSCIRKLIKLVYFIIYISFIIIEPVFLENCVRIYLFHQHCSQNICICPGVF